MNLHANEFASAADRWHDDVDQLAAQLLETGQAANPYEARTMAERRIQDRRRAHVGLSDGEVLAKRFEGGGALLGG